MCWFVLLISSKTEIVRNQMFAEIPDGSFFKASCSWSNRMEAIFLAQSMMASVKHWRALGPRFSSISTIFSTCLDVALSPYNNIYKCSVHFNYSITFKQYQGWNRFFLANFHRCLHYYKLINKTNMYLSLWYYLSNCTY